jgi:hypothetical protein
LEHGVKPPTPDAALLSGAAAAPMLLALQHVRLQLARVVRQHHPQQVRAFLACLDHSFMPVTGIASLSCSLCVCFEGTAPFMCSRVCRASAACGVGLKSTANAC